MMNIRVLEDGTREMTFGENDNDFLIDQNGTPEYKANMAIYYNTFRNTLLYLNDIHNQHLSRYKIKKIYDEVEKKISEATRIMFTALENAGASEEETEDGYLQVLRIQFVKMEVLEGR